MKTIESLLPGIIKNNYAPRWRVLGRSGNVLNTNPKTGTTHVTLYGYFNATGKRVEPSAIWNDPNAEIQNSSIYIYGRLPVFPEERLTERTLRDVQRLISDMERELSKEIEHRLAGLSPVNGYLQAITYTEAGN